MRLRTPRPPARIWISALRTLAPVLAASDANDVILFGSQAMSVYTERALASKDLDLIVPGITLGILERLCEALQEEAKGRPTFDFQVSEYLGRRYPVGHIYARHLEGFPIVVEFFQTFLGYQTTTLTPFLTFKQRWGLRVQVLTPEAIVGTRLAFRPPERITRFNAARLNGFIRALGRTIRWSRVNAFIDAFDLRELVLENLADLRSKQISIAQSSRIGKDTASRRR